MALFSKPTARTLAIIDLLMANPHRAYGLTDMTRQLKLNKATCHAILSTMKGAGFLNQDPKTKTYRLGPSMAAAGHAAFSQFPSLNYARTELKAIAEELTVNCSAIARSNTNLVTLAHYQHPELITNPLQTGLRLPNMAPLGACFIAWSPASQLQNWIEEAHQSQHCYQENLDQLLRIRVISIYKQGFEVTLKTSAEDNWINSLTSMPHCDLKATDQLSRTYQQALCNENSHLNSIDNSLHYDVSQISVPVFCYSNTPELIFSANCFEKPISGQQIKKIAARLKLASKRISQSVKESSLEPST